MSKDLLRYDKMVEEALRGVVRQALTQAAKDGLSGSHHFYVTFRTGHAGVSIPDYLVAKYPDEMTIVLEHQFWELEVEPELFRVTLSFQNRLERLVIPFGAVTAFADPSVKFGLQFQEAQGETSIEGKEAPKLKLADTPPPAPKVPAKLVEAPKPREASASDKAPGDKIVTLDQFRKK
jgi:hypothetical protein